MSVRAFSSGGGVQSTAALILSAERVIDYPVHLFAHVGERAEDPRTLEWVDDVLISYAERHGIEFKVLRKIRRGGEPDDLRDLLDRSKRSLPIPVRMANGAPGTRNCTQDFKIAVVAKELKARGATAESPATVGLGITMDEIGRVRAPRDERVSWQLRDYPLIDLNMRRSDCVALIRRAGLPDPPRSACIWCPFKSLPEWRRLKSERPDLFKDAVALEQMLNERRASLGKDEVWLTRFARPLAGVVDDQMTLDVDSTDSCESGYCMT